MKLTTKRYGSEQNWKVGTCSNLVRYSSYRTYNEQCCLPAGNYDLICKDSYGDGWNGGYIEIQGTRYCERFTSGREKAIEISIKGQGMICSFNYSPHQLDTNSDVIP